jgi:hypothetical protein
VEKRRSTADGVEQTRMLRSPSPDLERQLLRRGVGTLVAGRHHCRDCGRTPLVGERIFVYEHERMACVLCASLRRSEPLRVEIVHSSEHGHAVRIRDQRAA